MNCRRCGRTNRGEWRHCVNCGHELHTPIPVAKQEFCPSCGFGNQSFARFCASCGTYLSQPRAERVKFRGEIRPQKSPTQVPITGHGSDRRKVRKEHGGDTILRWHPAAVTLGLLGLSILLILVIQGLTNMGPSKPPELVEAVSNDPTIEARVREIAAKFVCSCGKCGEQPLDTCTCDRAIQERQFIRSALASGQSLEQVVEATMSTFGWIKPEFNDKYAADTSIRQFPSKLKAARELQIQPPSLFSSPAAAEIATVSNRAKILSYFQCPCGQCPSLELSDCNCTHPRGATEVKAFIDKKLTEGKYSVAELVAEVDRVYGGRKL